MIDIPKDFDWVTARHQCSLAEIFNRLITQVQKDVETRQSLRSGPPYDFGFRCAVENNALSVFVEGVPGVYESLHFFKGENAIEVLDGNRKKLLLGTPTLCDDGECRLKVNGEVKELWQFRKTALEDIFFASTRERLGRAGK